MTSPELNDVAPNSTISDGVQCRERNAKAGDGHFIGNSKRNVLTNSPDIIRGQLSPPASCGGRVQAVMAGRANLKVFRSIIAAVEIQMVDVLARLNRADECFGDKPMDAYCSAPPPKAGRDVPARLMVRPKDLRRHAPGALAGAHQAFNAANSAEAADFVLALASHNRAPFFVDGQGIGRNGGVRHRTSPSVAGRRVFAARRRQHFAQKARRSPTVTSLCLGLR